MFPATRRTDSSNCPIGRGMGLGQLGRGHANRVGRQRGLVDPGRIVQHGRQALFPHVAADALHHLLGRKRLAKNLDRPPPAGFADDVSLRAEPWRSSAIAVRISSCRLSMRRIFKSLAFMGCISRDRRNSHCVRLGRRMEVPWERRLHRWGRHSVCPGQAGMPARTEMTSAPPMAYNSWWTKKGERAWAWHPTTQPAGLWTSESSRSPVRRVRPGWQCAPRRPSGPFWNARDARAWSRCCRRPGGNRPSPTQHRRFGQTGMSAPPAGPPPLDRVAAGPLALELDLPEATLLGRLLGRNWLLWGVAPLATLTAVLTLLWLASSRPEPEPVALETERPATAIRTPARLSTERPATAVAGGEVDQSPDPPGPQSGGVQSRAAFQEADSQESIRRQPRRPRPADAKPPQPGPFTSVGKPAADAAAGDGHRTEVKKAPPPPVDVAARLADPVAELELTDMPLGKAVDLLAAMGTLPVTMDADAMTQLGVTARDPISLQLRSTTIGKALQAAAAQKGLTVAVENGQVFVTSPAEYRETLRTVRYTVADLTGGDKAAAAELAALVRKLVAPESWQPAGGRGTIEAERRCAGRGAKRRRAPAGVGLLREASPCPPQAAPQPRQSRALHLGHAIGPGAKDARTARDGQFSPAGAVGQDSRLPGRGGRERYSRRPRRAGCRRDLGPRRSHLDRKEAGVGHGARRTAAAAGAHLSGHRPEHDPSDHQGGRRRAAGIGVLSGGPVAGRARMLRWPIG